MRRLNISAPINVSSAYSEYNSLAAQAPLDSCGTAQCGAPSLGGGGAVRGEEKNHHANKIACWTSGGRTTFLRLPASAWSASVRHPVVVKMSHHGPFRCECGELHDEYDESNDLFQFVDNQAISCLNEAQPGSCKGVVRPYSQRLDTSRGDLCSDDDDPELMLHIPFTVAVKLSSFVVLGGDGGSAPAHVRAFINRDGLDFSDAANAAPVQEWDLAEDLLGALEYPTQRSKFQNVSSLTLHFTENHGGTADEMATRVRYVGLKGIGTQNRRGIVDALYEVRPVPKSNALGNETANSMQPGM